MKELRSLMFDLLDDIGVPRGGTRQGRQVYGLMRAMNDAVAGGYSILASSMLRNKVADIAARQVLKAAGSKSRKLFYKEKREIALYLSRFDVPIIYPEIGHHILARVPGEIVRGEHTVNLKDITDAALKELKDTSPMLMAEVASDAVKNIGAIISAEAGRAAFNKGSFNYVLDY